MAVLSLSARDFRLTMDLAFSSSSPGYRWLDATLSLQSTTLATSAAFACHGSLTVEDLLRLADLIEVHVRQLPSGEPNWVAADASDTDSMTWVTHEGPIQIQCLTGEATVEDGTLVGEFTVRIMLNLSEKALSHKSVYGGFEGTIDAQEAIAFCEAVRRLAADF
jgi:hypothetical protein